MVKTFQIDCVRAVHHNFARIDKRAHRANEAEILVLIVAAERSGKDDQGESIAVSEGEHLKFTTQRRRGPSEVTFVHFEVARPSWLRHQKMASPAQGFVLQRTKTLALGFFFNEAFRFDAQTYADGKH